MKGFQSITLVKSASASQVCSFEAPIATSLDTRLIVFTPDLLRRLGNSHMLDAIGRWALWRPSPSICRTPSIPGA
jgi:hypothetical protein